jgi:putative hemolysin
MSEFEIKITTDPGEIEEAQRLRFQVFNLEMNKGLQSSYQSGLDCDEFDPYCEHLIVRDASSNQVIGTYRLIRGSQARQNIGFYSEKEFDLTRIKNLDGELLELGRSCAHKDFRDKALIPMMWEAILQHIKTHRIRYLFGCGSLYTTDSCEISAMYSLFRSKYYAPEAFRVWPVQHCRFDALSDGEPFDDEQTLFQRLPSLIKGYLRVGALVCGPPALDSEFGTADFFLLLDVNMIKTEYLRRLRMTGGSE